MAINLNDESQNSNTLTNSGAAEVTSGLPFAQSKIAVDLEAGESDYLYAADSTSLSLSGDWTIEFNFNFESTPASEALVSLVSKYAAGAADRSYQIGLYNDGGTLRLQAQVYNSAGNQDVVRWPWTPTPGTWYQIAVTFDISEATATEFEFFLNGSSQGNGSVIVNTNVSDIDDNATRVELGASSGGSNNADGKMDEVRIWNDIRTDSEIDDNKAVELSNPVGETNLQAYWPFELLIRAKANPMFFSGGGVTVG
jgi:hypothetical protein